MDITQRLTPAEHAELTKGDRLVRISNGKTYIVSVVHNSVVHGHYVSAQIERNGKPFGRGYCVNADGAFALPQEVK